MALFQKPRFVGMCENEDNVITTLNNTPHMVLCMILSFDLNFSAHGIRYEIHILTLSRSLLSIEIDHRQDKCGLVCFSYS